MSLLSWLFSDPDDNEPIFDGPKAPRQESYSNKSSRTSWWRRPDIAQLVQTGPDSIDAISAEGQVVTRFSANRHKSQGEYIANCGALAYTLVNPTTGAIRTFIWGPKGYRYCINGRNMKG